MAEKPSGDQPDPQDAKAKMREALDRKNAKSAGPSHGGPHSDGGIHGARGAAGSKRVFRRKSG